MLLKCRKFESRMISTAGVMKRGTFCLRTLNRVTSHLWKGGWRALFFLDFSLRTIAPSRASQARPLNGYCRFTGMMT